MNLRSRLASLAIAVCGIPALLLGQSGGVKPATQPSAAPAQGIALQKKVEDYLRYLYGWDDTFKLTFGSPESTGMPDIVKITLTVTEEGQSQTGILFVSKDGNYMFRGEMEDLTSDPLAAVRAQINLDNSPSRGPASAKIVIVEYGDFQCPVCRSADISLRQILTKHPEVRFVFKDFPLVDIHPWAMTAATAGKCANQQSADGFWKLHDLIYDNQALISTSNAWDKMQELSRQAGLDADVLRGCMSDPKSQAEVAKSIQEGQRLSVTNTPTLFVNGRRMVGLDPATFERSLSVSSVASPPSH